MIYGIAGGFFAWYVFVHCLADWIPQSHYEAMHKSTNNKIRARHCAIYALLFLPILFLFGMCWWKILLSLGLLFASHFGIDTYYATIMWMKHVRRPPAFTAMTDMKFRWKFNDEDIRAFRTTIQEPVGAILMIAIDQFTHLLFLIPIVWMTVR
jgi:hypothetical protein